MSMMRDRTLDINLTIMQYLMIREMFAVSNHQLQSLLSNKGWDRASQEITCRKIDGLKFLQLTKKHIMEKFELNNILSLRLTNTRDNEWSPTNLHYNSKSVKYCDLIGNHASNELTLDLRNDILGRR